MTDRLKQMLMIQYDQQREILGGYPLDEAERIRIGAELAHGIIKEVTSYLDALGYNAILPRSETAQDRRAHRVIELVDILKYVFALGYLDAVEEDEYWNTFRQKTDIVAARARREMAQINIAGLDVDGVIADIDAAGYDWKASDAEKAAFFDGDWSTECPPVPGARRLTEWLKENGWGIVLVTARKRHLHPRLEMETYAWLKKHNIHFDRIIYAYDKAAAIADARLPIRFFIEDSPKHALDIASAKIPVLYVGKGDVPSVEGIVRCRDLYDAQEWIEHVFYRS